MTTVTTYFDRFLENIRLSKDLRDECSNAHNELRVKLLADPQLNPIFVSMFLQGSYARHTGTKPNGEDTHVDVDLVAVTSLDHNFYTPDLVVARFTPFLDREYPEQWQRNDRSIKIKPDDTSVTLDLVVTAAPSEEQAEFYKSFREAGVAEISIEAAGDAGSQESRVFRDAIERINKAFGGSWQKEPLLIPSRDLGRWEPTHPLEQIRWTTDKNERTGGHYVNVVKAMKWWRKQNPDGVYPKGYPLEHLVGDHCPDEIGSVAEGIADVLESIRVIGAPNAFVEGKPRLHDRGVPDNDPFKRVTPEQYAIFHSLVTRDGPKAKAALAADTTNESATRWREIFGPEFPTPAEPGFTPPSKPAQPVTRGRYG